MTAQWYLVRDSQGAAQGPAIGPMATAILFELASSGGVPLSDWVRMDGVDVDITVAQFLRMVESGNVPNEVESSVPAAPAEELPDWLSDVAASETPPAVPEATPLPEWIIDMLRMELASISLPKSRRARVAAGESETPVDWLEDIRQIEESLPATRQPEAAPPSRSAPFQPPPSAAHHGPLGAVAPGPRQPAAAPPSPAAPVSPSPQPPPLAAEPGPHGYDPATGRILDPIAYARWQKAESKRRQEELQQRPALSVAEIFLEAQRAVQEWVDADRNNSLVAYADFEVIRSCASVKQLLGRYEPYGPVLREKLLKRMAFLVQNRKKFFESRGMTV